VRDGVGAWRPGRDRDEATRHLYFVLLRDVLMPTDSSRKNRLLDLVIKALKEAKETKSELTVTLLEMVLLNEMDEEAATSTSDRPRSRHLHLN
jgi:hypothetical protein